VGYFKDKIIYRNKTKLKKTGPKRPCFC